MTGVEIADHAYKHGIPADDILHAWENFVRLQHRGAPNEGQILAIGPDIQGRLMQIVAVEGPAGVLIYHAMAPPTKKALLELGMEGGRHGR